MKPGQLSVFEAFASDHSLFAAGYIDGELGSCSIRVEVDQLSAFYHPYLRLGPGKWASSLAG